MQSRLKPNNVFGILIAIALIITGFVLGFINKRSESALQRPGPTVLQSAPAGEGTPVNDEDQADVPPRTRP